MITSSCFLSLSDFSEQIAPALHRACVFGQLKAKWAALMRVDLFRSGTAERFLMLEGGFSSQNMKLAVDKKSLRPITTKLMKIYTKLVSLFIAITPQTSPVRMMFRQDTKLISDIEIHNTIKLV